MKDRKIVEGNARDSVSAAYLKVTTERDETPDGSSLSKFYIFLTKFGNCLGIRYIRI